MLVQPFTRIEHTNIAFISDLHIGHSNIIKWEHRPFENINDMSDKLIVNWNSVIDDNTIVYYLGDLSYKVKFDYVKEFLYQLNGDIRVILGNHDRLKEMKKFKRFSDIQTYKRVEVIDNNANTKQDLILSHYPILSWDKQRHGAIHLHGHCHQNLTISNPEYYANNKVIDVGCMGHNYTPILYDEVIEIIQSKNI